MARKRKKKKKSIKNQFKTDLLGLFVIVVVIFGSEGSAISEVIIPGWLDDLFCFFFGIWYFIASIALFTIGIFLIIKKRFPNYKDKRLIGVYLFFFGLLLLTHIQVFEPLLLEKENPSILRLTWESFLTYLEDNGTSSYLGGGIVGAVLFVFNYYLFSAIGAKIIAVFSMILGLLFITNVSLDKAFLFIGQKLKKGFTILIHKWKSSRSKKDTLNSEEAPSVEIAPEHIEAQGLDDEPGEDFAEISYSSSVDAEVNSEQDDAEQTDLQMTNLSTYEEENVDYKLPSLSLLAEPRNTMQRQNRSHIQSTVRKLEKTFHSFGVQAKVTKVHVGPAVTKYEVNPAAGVKVSRIVNLHDDLALALAAQDIRIEAPIPGKSAVGIEVPNDDVSMVSLREVLDVTMGQPSKLMFALGRDISGDAVVGELDEMPHLLIAGATGSGKSVCINGIITTILMRAKPHEVKMMMIDPKKVELNIYNGIPHLLSPVVTDPKKAAQALRKVVIEMERRYELFSESATRNIKGYNEAAQLHNQNSEEKIP